MSLLLIGATGMLGSELRSQLNSQGIQVLAPGRTEFDLASPERMMQYFKTQGPFLWVINAAAYTQVDLCETQSELAFSLNAAGPTHLATLCKEYGTKLIHFSTDYVFDGQKESPYLETDSPNPINVYGQSKLAGEVGISSQLQAHYIFRLQWLYGQHGRHFLQAIHAKALLDPSLSIVSDQWGSPSWTGDIARIIVDIIRQGQLPFGIYHLANQGYTSWFLLAEAYFRSQKIEVNLSPILTQNFPRPAKRPLNSRLSLAKILPFISPPPLSWIEALDAWIKTTL